MMNEELKIRLKKCIMTKTQRKRIRQREFESLCKEAEWNRTNNIPLTRNLRYHINHLNGCTCGVGGFEYCLDSLKCAKAHLWNIGKCIDGLENKQTEIYNDYECLIEMIEKFDYMFTIAQVRTMYMLNAELPELYDQISMEGR